MIHFKCCPESDRYPCHKCHNQFMAAQEEERAKEQEENKPLIDNSNIEEVEEVSEQTKESTGLGASLATSPVEARTRKQEESKPLQQELPKLTKASGGRATARKPVTIQQMCTSGETSKRRSGK